MPGSSSLLEAFPPTPAPYAWSLKPSEVLLGAQRTGQDATKLIANKLYAAGCSWSPWLKLPAAICPHLIVTTYAGRSAVFARLCYEDNSVLGWNLKWAVDRGGRDVVVQRGLLAGNTYCSVIASKLLLGELALQTISVANGCPTWWGGMEAMRSFQPTRREGPPTFESITFDPAAKADA